MMNREILFRGKTLYDHYDHYASPEPDTKEGTWVYGDLMTEYTYHKGLTIVENGVYHEVDPATVGQLAILDGHNDMIFEGDILQNPEFPDENWQVFFDKKGLVWSVKELSAGELMSLAELMESDPEVHGNIHDNPELLEVLGDD